jgi:hypothetical protein
LQSLDWQSSSREHAQYPGAHEVGWGPHLVRAAMQSFDVQSSSRRQGSSLATGPHLPLSQALPEQAQMPDAHSSSRVQPLLLACGPHACASASQTPDVHSASPLHGPPFGCTPHTLLLAQIPDAHWSSAEQGCPSGKGPQAPMMQWPESQSASIEQLPPSGSVAQAPPVQTPDTHCQVPWHAAPVPPQTPLLQVKSGGTQRSWSAEHGSPRSPPQSPALAPPW